MFGIGKNRIKQDIVYIFIINNSLKKTYRRLFDQDFLYATSHRIEDKIWRYIFYAEIETVRAKLRQVKMGKKELVLYHVVTIQYKTV
jgi:hypothetical protein